VAREGERVSKPISPRGTFLKIAERLKAQIEADDTMTELPSAAEVMRDYGVSRGVALRVFEVLHKDGLAEPVPGSRWRVRRHGESADRRSLVEKVADVIAEDGLSVGSEFPSSAALCERFGTSRPTLRRALDQLEAKGLLSAGQQGKPRLVRAVPE
jgi:DNA-binding FadR family transcriptional regulator